MAKASLIGKTAAVAAAVCAVVAGASVFGAAADGSVELPVIPITDETQVYQTDGFKYKLLGNGKAELVGCTREDDTMLIIPAELDGWVVTSLGEGALGVTNSFGTVVVPSSVKSVSKHAILGADVDTVIFPAGLGEIDDEAVCTKKMIAAYVAHMGGMNGGDLGELELMGSHEILKPVGDLLTVKCASGSGAALYADRIGANKIVIEGYTTLSGDVNCDGVRNNRDLKQLQKYIENKDRTLFTPSFDVDGNGKIEGADIRRLQSSLVGENVTVY